LNKQQERYPKPILPKSIAHQPSSNGNRSTQRKTPAKKRKDHKHLPVILKVKGKTHPYFIELSVRTRNLPLVKPNKRLN